MPVYMPNVQSLFDDYAAYHQTAGNKAFHRLGIPLIMLSLLGMLARIRLVSIPASSAISIDAAILLIIAAEVFYLRIEWRLGLAMLAFSVAFYFAGAALPMKVNVALFILGWIFQFVGHSVFEHRNPAFFRNFLHLLVGPLWILNDLIPVVKRI